MKEKIKVCHVLPDLIIGGAHLLTLDICEKLDKNRFDSWVTCVVNGGELEREAYERDISIHVINRAEHKFRAITWLQPCTIYKLYKHIKEKKPHIVQTHLFPAGVIGKIASNIASVPFIMDTVHNTYTWKNKCRSALLMDKCLSKFTDIYLCNSQTVLNYTKEQLNLPENLLRMIHLGVDVNKFNKVKDKDSLKKYYNLKNDDIVIGCASRLVAHKNIIDSIRIVGLLKNKIKNIKLIIIGDGEQKSLLKTEVINLGLKDDVLFFDNRRDMPILYNLMDIFLQLSEREGFGLSMVEAMACGVPVIANNVTAIPEIVGSADNAILLNTSDLQDVANYIEEIVNNRELYDKLAINGQRLVETKYTSERMLIEISSFYERIYDFCITNGSSGRQKAGAAYP